MPEQFLTLTGLVFMGLVGWALLLFAIYLLVLCSNRLTHLVLDAYGGWETFMRYRKWYWQQPENRKESK